MSAGATQTPVVQQQQSSPWSGAQPYLSGLYQSAASMANNNIGYTPYSGPTQAGLDPSLTSGLSNILNIANPDIATGTASNQASLTAANQILGNQGLTQNQQGLANTLQGTQNPYLQGVINQQMAGVNSAMSGAGRYGSGAHEAAIAQAISPTLAQDYMQRQQMLQQMYGQGAQQLGQFAQLAPQLEQQRYMPAEMAMGVGQFYSDRAQNLLNDQIKLFNAQQAYPWEQQQRLASVLSGAGGLGGTTVTSSSINQPSALQRMAGGALVGAGLGSAIPGVGTGLGAVGGGLGGLFL